METHRLTPVASRLPPPRGAENETPKAENCPGSGPVISAPLESPTNVHIANKKWFRRHRANVAFSPEQGRQSACHRRKPVERGSPPRLSSKPPKGGDRFDLARDYPAFSGSEHQERHCIVHVY
jgi:hypothetical protein